MKQHFDQFSKDYKEQVTQDVRIFGEEYDYFSKMKVNLLKDFIIRFRTLSSNHLSIHILEVGCGNGGIQTNLNILEIPYKSFAFDPSFESVKIAASESQESIHFTNADASRLPYQSAVFDVVFFSVVVHHIPSALRQTCFNETFRVLKQGGVVLVFEHNPYNPLTRWVVKHSKLDIGVELISRKKLINQLQQAGLRIKEKRYTTFFPKFLRFFRPFEPRLKWCAAGGQYFVGAIKP
jgi:ubiquinone/menaquinone biosynthesis C-methylase UbiE